MCPNVHYANVLQILVGRCRESHSHPTTPHGPHLVGLVKEAAPTPLEQELDVLINTAAGKLPGQMESALKNQTGRDQDIGGEESNSSKGSATRRTTPAPLCRPTETIASVGKHHSDASLEPALFRPNQSYCKEI